MKITNFKAKKLKQVNRQLKKDEKEIKKKLSFFKRIKLIFKK
jgi:hypothetical protein